MEEIMSWDVLKYNSCGSPPKDMENLRDEHKPDPLGSASTVRMSISQNLPGFDWSDPTWGIYDGDEFLIEFNTGEEDPINSIMLHVRGGSDAIAAILRFANPNKWSLLDFSTGEFLDPENPSQKIRGTLLAKLDLKTVIIFTGYNSTRYF